MSAPPELPEVVSRAFDVSRRAGYVSFCRNETGRLLAALAATLATGAAEIFTEDPQVEVLAADWSTLLDKGPFSLLFLDSGQPGEVGVDSIADLVEEGGIVVLDDFTPCE